MSQATANLAAGTDADAAAVPATPPAEPYQDRLQQRHAATLGMWAFIAQETLFFGGLFAAFYVMRLYYPADFAAGAKQLYWWLGGLNTAVLLVSSFAVAQAVLAAEKGDARRIVRWLLVALVLAFGFLVIKGTEYTIDYREHLIPGLNYTALSPDGSETRPAHVKLFMCFYFISTALHAVHVIVGIGLLGLVAVRARLGQFSKDDHNFVDGVGLYWHFVDLVWIFLYPTLYLLRHA